MVGCVLVSGQGPRVSRPCSFHYSRFRSLRQVFRPASVNILVVLHWPCSVLSGVGVLKPRGCCWAQCACGAKLLYDRKYRDPVSSITGLWV